jgi:hypothetical protein
MNIESKLWKIRAVAPHMVMVIQKASGATRYATESHFPSTDALAVMSEKRFDKVCREVFHGLAQR